MRRTADTVIARRLTVAETRAAGTADRLARLTALAPNADPAHLKYLAIHCGTVPTFPTILAVLASLTPSEN